MKSLQCLRFIQRLLIPCELMLFITDILWQHYLTDVCQGKKEGAEGVGVSEGWCFKANVWETEIKRVVWCMWRRPAVI